MIKVLKRFFPQKTFRGFGKFFPFQNTFFCYLDYFYWVMNYLKQMLKVYHNCFEFIIKKKDQL